MIIAAFALAVSSLSPIRQPSDVASAADAAFSDDACPQANGPGRKLNGIDPSAPGGSDAMIAAAGGLVDAYRDCARSFDATLNSKNNDAGSSDYIIVHRVYARLQLARSLRRLAQFASQMNDPVKARADYDAALEPLAQIDGIVANSDNRSTGSEGKLLAQSRELSEEIKAERSKLLPVAEPTVPAPQKT